MIDVEACLENRYRVGSYKIMVRNENLNTIRQQVAEISINKNFLVMQFYCIFAIFFLLTKKC